MLKYFDNFLTKIQNLTRLDIRYLISGGSLLGLNQVTSALIGLGLTIAFANLVSPEVYGTYKYIIATYSLIAIATLPGVDVAVLRAVSQGYDRTFISGIRLKMKWGILGSIASLCYASYNFYIEEQTLGIIFVLVAIAVPFMETGALYTTYLNAKKEYRLWTIAEIITQIVSTVSLLTTVYFSQSLIALIIAYLLPYVILRSFFMYLVVKRVNRETQEDSDMRTYAQSITAFQILTRLIVSIDQIILFHFLGPASVAIFSIANAIPNRVKGLFRITGILAFPKLALRSGADVFQSLPRKMFLFSLLILSGCIIYILLVPLLFIYVFPQYAESTIYSQVLIFFTLSGITYPFSSFLFAHKKIKENYIYAISSFSVKIISLFIFVPLYGIWGAVISVLAAAFTTVICTFFFLYQGRNDTNLVTVSNDSNK